MTVTSHILRVPTEEYARHTEPERWCFGCRKRLPGVTILHRPTDPLSYYGPHATYECDGCHQDRRLFPGYEWEHDLP